MAQHKRLGGLKLAFRNLKYNIYRKSPPTLPAPLLGPVLIVGSAPIAHKPVGFDDRFSVITINGSQVVTKKWGIAVPDVTFIQSRQFDGMNMNALEVRRVLKGERTRMLYALLWREGLSKLNERLQGFDYQCDRVRIVNRYERLALTRNLIGSCANELDAETKVSNGIIAVLFAIHNQATAIIISGINPDSSGHVYNDANLVRLHAKLDREILVDLQTKGYPLYTADPEVAESTGLPLWDEQALESYNSRYPLVDSKPIMRDRASLR